MQPSTLSAAQATTAINSVPGKAQSAANLGYTPCTGEMTAGVKLRFTAPAATGRSAISPALRAVTHLVKWPLALSRTLRTDRDVRDGYDYFDCQLPEHRLLFSCAKCEAVAFPACTTMESLIGNLTVIYRFEKSTCRKLR